ncbi:MAG: PAS domain-containing protein [Proteobacteria bacterium]|nr:PAS domain-containing protein [Pseudomonadota bacterium]
MRHNDKTKDQPINELEEISQRADELEKSEIGCAQAALRKSEEYYRLLVNLTPDIIYRLNEDGKIEYISPAVRRLGYEPEELIGTLFEKIVHPSDRGKTFNKFVERRVDDKRIQNMEIRLLTKGNKAQDWAFTQKIVKLSSRGQWNVPDAEMECPDKSFLYTQGIARDITEQKQAEEALKFSEIKYRRLFETATDGVLILDADTGTINDINPSLLSMLNYTKENIIRKKLCEIDAFKDFDKKNKRFAELKKIGHVSCDDLHLTTKDGVPISAEFVCNTYLVDKERVAQCNIRNITERKRAEKEREKLILELKDALTQIKTLSGLLNICSYCKKICNDKGTWEQMEIYIRDRSEADFSHGICPECAKKIYPQYFKK